MQVWMIDAVSMTPYYNASLCRALLAEGCAVTMITSPFIYDPWPIYKGTNTEFQFSRFLAHRPLRFARSPRVRRLMRALEYPLDLLHVFGPRAGSRPLLHFQWAALPALDAWVWRYLKHAGYPLVLTAHDILPHNSQRPPLGQERLYGTPDRIIVHTPALAREFRERFPGASARIRIIPHGTLFEDVPEIPRGVARNALELPMDAPVALFWGLVEPYKGIECLIKAFSQVARELPAARLLLVGKPNVPVQLYLDLIERVQLVDAIHTRFEFVPTEQASLYFGAADLVVLPYLEASQSGVLLAAYRFGRAVVVTATGGLPDTVQDGANGLVVSPGDEPALARAMIEILSNPARMEEMGERSYRMGVERYNWQTIARQTLAVYREVREE
jgi:glycosyltransferase involved in cell wall biosynthesis